MNPREWDVDLDDVFAALVCGTLIIAILAGLAWMSWADMTNQCFGPAWDSHLMVCEHGHAVPAGVWPPR